MFLSKEIFEAEGGPQPAAHAGPSYGSRSRPTSATGLRRPSTSGTTAWTSEESEDQQVVPGSVAGMRAKMQQHRQSLLAKQRQGPSSSGGSVVRASAGVPIGEVATPMAVRGASSTGLSSALTETLAEQAAVEAGEGGEGSEDGAVVPEVSAAPEVLSPEEEARHRSHLLYELSQRGMGQEFDPTETQDNQPAFDIGSLAAHQMKAFLQNPTPKQAGMVLCRIVRDRNGISNKLHPKYIMESDDGAFLMTAQKQMKNKTANYAISMSRTQHVREEETFLGKLRSDFMGVEWTAYGPGLNPAKADPSMPQMVREELLSVVYVASKWGSSARGPQQMSVVMPRVQASGERLACRTMHPQTDGLLALQRSGDKQFIDSYRNKPPKWSEQKGTYVLNFNRRVTEASVKNFQLVDAESPDTVYLQFGRVGKDAFNLDFRYPISPVQAFALCLSSFDYKLGCS